MKKTKKTNNKIPSPFDVRKIEFRDGCIKMEMVCPRCQSENCSRDDWYRTGEELVNCPECGYHRRFSYQRDNKGSLVKLYDASGEFSYNHIHSNRYVMDNPFGVCKIEKDDGSLTTETFETISDYEDFVSDIECPFSCNEDIQKVTLHRFVNGNIIKEVIFPKVV